MTRPQDTAGSDIDVRQGCKKCGVAGPVQGWCQGDGEIPPVPQTWPGRGRRGGACSQQEATDTNSLRVPARTARRWCTPYPSVTQVAGAEEGGVLIQVQAHEAKREVEDLRGVKADAKVEARVEEERFGKRDFQHDTLPVLPA